jgi:L-lactate dehydrogenase complex protein LldG
MVAKTMSAARDEILRRIRAVSRTPAAPAARTYRSAGRLSANERLALFHERVSDYRADVRLVEFLDIAKTIEAVCAEHDARRLGIAYGLPADWRPEGLDLVEGDDLAPPSLDALDGVVTGCTVAIAETGTIVLSAAPADGSRALTLVPDLHICVVGETQIVELVPEAIELLHGVVASERRPLTFVSGPSATSDIELSRVEGVHGPRTLVVIIVKETA